MRKLICGFMATLTVVVVGALPATTLAQELKLGVFDPARVSSETAIGKRVQAELTAFRDTKQAEIAGKEASITALQTKLQQQELTLSPDRRSTMERDIQRQLLDLQSARETATRELQLEVNTAQAAFEEKLILAVQKFGKDEGFTLVLDRGLIAWADDTIDVTEKIVSRFDEMFPVTGP